jgi:predicted transcriptional regulator
MKKSQTSIIDTNALDYTINFAYSARSIFAKYRISVNEAAEILNLNRSQMYDRFKIPQRFTLLELKKLAEYLNNKFQPFTFDEN